VEVSEVLIVPVVETTDFEYFISKTRDAREKVWCEVYPNNLAAEMLLNGYVLRYMFYSFEVGKKLEDELVKKYGIYQLSEKKRELEKQRKYSEADELEKEIRSLWHKVHEEVDKYVENRKVEVIAALEANGFKKGRIAGVEVRISEE